MKISRRALLGASLGLGQVALLSKFGLLRDARADGPSDGPTRMLVLYLQGGTRPYTFFVPPGSNDQVARFIPPPADSSQEPVYFRPEQLVELAPADSAHPALRIAQMWNPNDPKDRTGFKYTPAGYGWKHYGLSAKTAVIHGVNQGAFDHAGAYVAAMCGIPGATYRAPAFVSVVANYLNRRFAESRPLPCVAIRGSGMPDATGLPPAMAPILVPAIDGIATQFSTDPATVAWWKGHETRTPGDIPSFTGEQPPRNVAATDLERFVLERTRALRGKSSTGTDAYLEQMYDGYAQTSATLARDVVNTLNATKGAEYPVPSYCPYSRFGFTYGLANGGYDFATPFDLTLKLLKSDLTSVVYAFLNEEYYDYHNGAVGHARGTAAMRAELDIIARLLGEMKQTPAPGQPGKTLYDDTVVVILSEFSRTWARGPNQSSLTGWSIPDDHFNYASVILSGGNIAGNRQIGGFDLDPVVRGQPVSITEESGSVNQREIKASDVIATICGAFGMKMGADFFIPGGYGQINDVVRV